MFVDKPPGGSRSWPVYVATIVACAVFLSLAVMAFQISTDVVGPVPAESGPQTNRLLRAWRFMARPVQPVALVNKSASLPQSQVPVVISRAPDDGMTGAVLPDEMASPDVDEWTSTERWSPQRPDTFRTVCVRLCDGAFFPVSFATTRDRFRIDAARCKAGCGSPARLFVGPPDGELDKLVDLKGLAYSGLPNAFKFRTDYNASCTCNGQPWETAELERHKALGEEAKVVAAKPANLETVAADKVVPIAPQTSNNVEIAALHPVQSPRTVAPVEPVRLQAARPESVAVAGSVAAAVAVVEASERKKTGAARKVARAAGNKAGKARSLPVAGPIANPFQIVFGTPPKTFKAKAQVVDTSMQRPFKPKEYWRLSFWEVVN